MCVVDVETPECGPGACLDPGQAGWPDLARLLAGLRSYLHGVHPDRVVDHKRRGRVGGSHDECVYGWRSG